MPTSLPPSVREHFGEEVADDFARWLDETFQQRAVHRDEYREVLSRLDVLEEGFTHMEKRFDLLEEHVDDRLDDMEKRFDDRLDDMEKRFEDRFEQIDQRFEQVDQRFESMEERFDKRFESMDAKLDRMNDRILSMTRWLIGLVALFGSLVTALLAVAQFGG
jgi:DNA anti-recombination protein RmuC